MHDIWNGPELSKLRTALRDGDYSLGCQQCGVANEAGHRLSSHAEEFDRYPEGVAEWPRRLEFALSNTCNLQCIHCNGELSSAIRTQREGRAPLRSPYDDRFFDQIADFLPHVQVAVFIGGEPFLAREARRMWDLLIERDLHPEVHVTTNGTIWNDETERYVRALEMSVAISIDGETAAVNDAIRQGSALAQVDATRRRLKDLTGSYGGAFTVNHCLLTENWRGLCRFLLDADRRGDEVHVIPVWYPPELSLFCLPIHELELVVAELEAQDQTMGHRLTINGEQWQRELAHLRDHLEGRRREEVAVGLSPGVRQRGSGEPT